MRRELAAAERHAAVRDAARGWAKAGAIGEDTRLDIDTRFPVDRVGKPLVWRILIFFFSCVILCSFFGLVAATNRPSRDGFTVLALFSGSGSRSRPNSSRAPSDSAGPAAKPRRLSCRWRS